MYKKRKMANIAINGFGRIGKQFFIAAIEQSVKWNFFINHLGELGHIIYSLKHDSVHPSIKNVRYEGNHLIAGSRRIPVFCEREPEKLPWKKEKIDLVVECTGVFTEREGSMKHILAGARKVLISAPAKGPDVTIGFGVNNQALKKSHKIISAGSCTTNCLAPMAKILNDHFRVKNAQFMTAHAYTSTQHLIDSDEKKDLRRGRAAAMNIIPTTSGADLAVVEMVPELKGKISGYALRVPVIDGSIANLYAEVHKRATIEEINKIFKKEAQGKMKSILEYTEDPIVSTDIIHNPSACVFDSNLTRVNGDIIGIAGWYDNEWGYSCRLVDMVKLILSK